MKIGRRKTVKRQEGGSKSKFDSCKVSDDCSATVTLKTASDGRKHAPQPPVNGSRSNSIIAPQSVPLPKRIVLRPSLRTFWM